MFFPPNVAGWPGGKSWINPATLLLRGNYVQMMLFPNPETLHCRRQGRERGIPQDPAQFPGIQDCSARLESQSGADGAGLAGEIRPDSRGYQSRVDGRTDERQAGPASLPGEVRAIGTCQDDGGALCESRSKMSQVANAERFNLAVGVYHGFVEAYDRVKPIPRDTTQVSFTEMVARVAGGDRRGGGRQLLPPILERRTRTLAPCGDRCVPQGRARIGSPGFQDTSGWRRPCARALT